MSAKSLFCGLRPREKKREYGNGNGDSCRRLGTTWVEYLEEYAPLSHYITVFLVRSVGGGINATFDTRLVIIMKHGTMHSVHILQDDGDSESGRHGKEKKRTEEGPLSKDFIATQFHAIPRNLFLSLAMANNYRATRVLSCGNKLVDGLLYMSRRPTLLQENVL